MSRVALAERIELLLSLHRPGEAERLVRDGLSRDPDWEAGYCHLARCLVEGRPARLAEALDAARVGVARQPADSWALAILGWVLHRRGLLEEAATTQREALRLNPFSLFARAQLGWIALDRGQPLQALTAIRDGLTLDPTNTLLLEVKASAEMAAWDLDAAENTVTLALTQYPTTALFHYLAGQLHQFRAGQAPLRSRLPHCEAAAQSLSEAVRLDPAAFNYRHAYEAAVARVGWVRSVTGALRAAPPDLSERLTQIHETRNRTAASSSDSSQSEPDRAEPAPDTDVPEWSEPPSGECAADDYKLPERRRYEPPVFVRWAERFDRYTKWPIIGLVILALGGGSLAAVVIALLGFIQAVSK
jgi:tetratricopeptide (TPR) repeat protein